MTDAEWAVHKAFYDLTVKERDAAWVECAHLRAEIERLRERLAIRIQHCHNLRTMLESATDTERAAVVAWLREVSPNAPTRRGADELAWCAERIERGKHRREEEK